MRIALAVAALLLAASAQAQTAVIHTVPSPPRADVPFVIQVTMSSCYTLTGVTVNGNNIDLIVQFAGPCLSAALPITEEITVPALPAGNYTVRLIASDSTTPFFTQALAIVADIPALDTAVMILLAAVLGLIAIAAK